MHYVHVEVTKSIKSAVDYLAMKQFEELLELNPNDNQGARGLMFIIYLEAGKFDAAKSLLDKYPEEPMNMVTFGRKQN
jgi:tetratricopeptide (TPR) repeat protein